MAQLLHDIDSHRWEIEHILNMRNVEIKREDVLAKLRENRKRHEGDQAKAVKVWSAKIKERLEGILVELTKGKTPQDIRDLVQDLEKPTDVLQAYDDAVAMIEMDVRPTIILTADEFRCYMQDRWSWKQTWSTSNSKYLGG